jgi:hypothetical protein
MTFAAPVGAMVPLASIAGDGGDLRIGASITTVGAQAFPQHVLIVGDAVLTAANGDISMAGVDGMPAGGASLTARSTTGEVSLGEVGDSASLAKLTIEQTGDLQLSSVTIDGNLRVLTHGGALAQYGNLHIGGSTTLEVGAAPITLNSDGNRFTGPVYAQNSGANDVSMHAGGTLTLGRSVIGSGSLTLESDSLAQMGPITQAEQGGPVFLTAWNGDLTLTAANALTGLVVPYAYGNLAIENDVRTFSLGDVFAAGRITLTNQTGDLVLGGDVSSAGDPDPTLHAVALNATLGAIRQTGGVVTASSVTAHAGRGIDLHLDGGSFSGTNLGLGNIVVSAAHALVVDGITNDLGDFTVHAGEALSLANETRAYSITLQANSGISVGNASVHAMATATLEADADHDGHGAITFAAGDVAGNSLSLSAAEGIALHSSAFFISATNTTAGQIALAQSGNVALGLIGNHGRSVSIHSDSGAIYDGNGAQPNFDTAKVSLSAPGGIFLHQAPTSLGDFNSDGRPDLVTVSGGRVNVYLASGAQGGVFATRPSASLSGAKAPTTALVGDFNDDGYDDLAVFSASTHRVSVFAGKGDGTFSAPAVFLAGRATRGFLAGDFNNDGRADLAAVESAGVDVLLNETTAGGTTAFGGAKVFAAGKNLGTMLSGDFDGDGSLDLAVANGGGHASLALLHGDGTGTFSLRPTAALPPGARQLQAADLTGDGVLDVAYLAPGNLLGVMAGKGDGTFDLPSYITAPSGSALLVVGDFHHSVPMSAPHLDLMTTNPNRVANIIYNLGGGIFSGAYAPVPMRFAPASAVVADVNGDGIPDVVLQNAGQFRVLLGNGVGGFLN